MKKMILAGMALFLSLSSNGFAQQDLNAVVQAGIDAYNRKDVAYFSKSTWRRM